MDISLIHRSYTRQMKFRGLLYLIYGFIIFLLLLIIVMCYELGKWAVFLLIAVDIGFVLILPCFHVIRFVCMIRRQERQFVISFSDEDVNPLWKNGPAFVTDNWFILAGTAAFYRCYIKTVDWQCQRQFRGVGRYYLIIKAIDGHQYRLPLDSKSGCMMVKRWWKTGQGEIPYEL